MSTVKLQDGDGNADRVRINSIACFFNRSGHEKKAIPTVSV